MQPALATTRFLIHDPDTVWFVESGTVDLFLAAGEGDGGGPRRHLLRVTQGGAVFGMPRGGCRILAIPGPETIVRETPRQGFDDWDALDRWVTELTEAVVGAMPPKRYEPLEAGAVTAVDRRPVSPRHGLVWAEPVEGCAHFLGDRSTAGIVPGCLFPVSSKGWLEPVEAMQFGVYGTAEFVLRDPAWSGLRQFHECVLALLERGAAEDSAKELARAERRARSDNRRLNLALRRLAAPLGGRAAAAEDRPTDDPWLAACQALGEQLKVDFVAGSARRDGGPAADPVESIARASGVRYRTVLLAEGWWAHEHGPMLARREADRAPVALVPAARGYEWFDPSSGARHRVNAQFAATLEPFGWFFYRPFPARPIGVAELMRFGLLGAKPELLTILLAGVGAALIAMVLPFATGYVFDSVIPGAKRGSLATVALILVVAAVCGALFELMRGFALLRLEGRMDAAVQAAVWDRLLEAPVAFFRRYSAGDLASRGLGIQAMRQILTGSAVTSLLSGIFSLTSFILLFHYNSKLAVVAAGLTLVAFLFVGGCGYAGVRAQRRMAEMEGHLAGTTLQIVNGIAKIRVSGAESRAFAVWAREFAGLKTVAVRNRALANRVGVFTAAWPVLCSLAIFSIYAGSLLTAAKSAAAAPMTTGEFVGFTAAFAQMLQGSLGFASALLAVLGVAPIYERSKPILEAVPEAGPNTSQPGELSGDIEVRHVTFHYRADLPAVLQDVSLRIAPGQFVAVVGPSGSGKSTLFRMLLRFETPQSGSIYYDRRDLATLDVQALRQQIGVVLQNGRIRAGSIHKNIVGTANLTVEEAWEAARMAGLDADIEAMPMGMQTVLGEGGGSLSGGQRQRLLIARALVRRPRIVLFDEATSALDNATQSIVSRSMDNLRATRVVIAHRLSTIERADWIYVMEKGQVVQQGTYSELMAQGGPFAELARRQLT
jgi:ATP-binding cassette subfamily C protein